MAKQALQASQISAAIQHMSGEGMPQFMWTNAVHLNVSGKRKFFERLGKLVTAHRTAAARREHVIRLHKCCIGIAAFVI